MAKFILHNKNVTCGAATCEYKFNVEAVPEYILHNCT